MGEGVTAVTGILEQASPPALVSAVEDNLYALWKLLGQWEKLERYQGPDMQWNLSAVPFPLFNGVTDVHLDEEDADAVIASLIGRARAAGVPFMAWLGPSTRPNDMGARLMRAGFLADEPTPGMVLDLRDLGQEPSEPEGLIIERVTDSSTLHQYCRAFVDAFEMPAFVEEPFAEILASVGLRNDTPVQHFLASLEGAPVATASVFLGAGVAGVYNVATLPSARRRGVGRAITHRLLAWARQAGFRFGILHASPAGAPLYRLMGFHEVCTVATYVWTPDGADHRAVARPEHAASDG